MAGGVALPGELDQEGTAIPVSIRLASRISLFVTFPEGRPPPDRSTFRSLRVRTPAREAELSSCRFHAEPSPREGGRLVFLDDVYDCEALLRQGKLVDLKGFFRNLPLVIAQKDRVKTDFRDYVAGAMYDLSVYKRFFNEQDRILAHEPPHVRDVVQQTLIRTEGRHFLQFFDAQLARLEALVAPYDKEEHERHGFYLRRQAWEFIFSSEFLKRTNLKPRGYAGDAEMMQMLYENQYEGDSVFGRLLHKHPVETAAAQAVRNRRKLIPRQLRDVLGRFPELPAGAFKIFSVASGPARELEDVFVGPEDFERFHCTLLDQDPEALESARQTVARIEGASGQRMKVDYLNDSVRTMLRAARLTERFGQFHFIYSMGLFDYLTPPVARAVLDKLYGLVVPGGELVIGNYHVNNPTRVYMAYWMDWVLYHRTEDEMQALADGAEGARVWIDYDATRSQMFLHLEKPR